MTTEFDGHVLVIGSAGVDIKGRPEYTVISGAPVPGHVRSSVGGVARNIAENLARLEVPTILLSIVGDDGPGARVLARCEDAGVDITHVRVLAGERTGHYLAILTPEGERDIAIADYDIARHLDSAYLNEHKDLFAEANLIVIDASMDDATLDTLFRLATQHDVLVCADPTSPSLAGRLRPYLDRIYLITPNITEASILCGETLSVLDPDAALNAARTLLRRGVRIAVITLGMHGLVYASGTDQGQIPSIRTEVRDETGAGDALTSAVIFGLLNEVPLDEAMRLGVSAASLTLRSRETVVPLLSQELLYDELVI